MARYNYLIQRHISGDNNGNPSAGVNVDWRDAGPFNGIHTRDSYGNMGYSTRKEARSAATAARKAFPDNTYRIIQIVS